MVVRPGSVVAASGFQLNLRSVRQVLRSLLPLALVCVAWTMPAVAASKCRHLSFEVTPERRALLNTIRYAEGTWRGGNDDDDEGYRVFYGGTLFQKVSHHPNRVNHGRYSSRAAGAYQFLPATWEMAKKALQLTNFSSPSQQDKAALYLICRREALELADRGVFTNELAHRLAPEWASFPKRNGHSYYGQPVQTFPSLQRFYKKNLAQLRRGRPSWSSLAAAELPPPPLPTSLAANSSISQSHPTPTRLIPVASSADCDGELMCLLDHVAYGGAPIQPESTVSRS
ncbi:MAG: glycoside hydrolase family 104 protein [Synechococcus sp. SB0662_bin_45]|nr:glycoside hydrolase family 104 protein [Synechococcus sp. SB0668_bin_13]MYE22328.1 glycoside hydrolase family 104 protein [Synechococcus sp. SB0662_bin_45]